MSSQSPSSHMMCNCNCRRCHFPYRYLIESIFDVCYSIDHWILCTPWFINLYIIKMKLGTLIDHAVVFFITVFRAIDVFLNLLYWTICSYVFSIYFVYFESNDSKYTRCSSLDDNTNSCKFCIGNTSAIVMSHFYDRWMLNSFLW